MKALLYVLIKNFAFELAVEKENIIVRQGYILHLLRDPNQTLMSRSLIVRPSLKGEKEDQMPMLIRRAFWAEYKVSLWLFWFLYLYIWFEYL